MFGCALRSIFMPTVALAQSITRFAGLVTGPRLTEFGSSESQFWITASPDPLLGVLNNKYCRKRLCHAGASARRKKRWRKVLMPFSGERIKKYETQENVAQSIDAIL